MSLGNSNKQQNKQSNGEQAVFAGERLMPFTKGILLAQAGISLFLSLWFILAASVEHQFLVMLTSAIHPGVAAMGVVAVFSWAVILLRHVDVLVKEVKS